MRTRVISKEVQEQLKSFIDEPRFKLETSKLPTLMDMVIEDTLNKIVVSYNGFIRFSAIKNWDFSTAHMYFDADAERPTIVYDETFKSASHKFIEFMRYYGYTFDTLFEVVICSDLSRLNAYKREAARRIEEHEIEEESKKAKEQRQLKIDSLFRQLKELGVTFDTYYSNE